MPRRFPGSSIAVSLSTHGSWMPGWLVQHVAATAGVTGLDIDATTTLSTWLVTHWGSQGTPYVRVHTVWVPYYGLHAKPTRRLLDSVLELQAEQPPLIIVALPGLSSMRALARDHAAIRGVVDTSPVAIGLTPSSLRGGRPHLVQLGALRHFVEEWDLSLAIDLSGSIDPTWEAEAAISRLGERLALMRLRASASSRTAVGQDRVACRALHAAIDRGHFIEIAICAARTFPIPTSPRAAASALRLASDYVGERMALHADALRAGIDHFEGSTPSRGS